MGFENTRHRNLALDIAAPVSIRVNRRARRICLRINAAERIVELVLPPGVPASQGMRFAASKREWIAARLDALPPPVAFVEGAVVPVLGVPHRIRREVDPHAPPVRITDAEIRVRGDPMHLSRRVRDFLVRMARTELSRRARLLAAQIGRDVGRVSVRDTKSRWGSCSGLRNLSFSWRLILAPEQVANYVVAHEVAHLAEMNHSQRFWRLVDSLSPDSAQARAWLKRHRSRLLSYGQPGVIMAGPAARSSADA
ncbi:MAG: M48 family metallopeptidase [Alphaproteobacteria bacterium]|nr:M48 family metallopeptidase [Alphaproteobacteria bacterium]